MRHTAQADYSPRLRSPSVSTGKFNHLSSVWRPKSSYIIPFTSPRLIFRNLTAQLDVREVISEMMNRSIIVVCGVLALTGLTSCQRGDTNGPVAVLNSTRSAAAPPPTQAMEMVCRNSQTGQKVECGTPNAVMVGMRPKSGGNSAASPNS